MDDALIYAVTNTTVWMAISIMLLLDEWATFLPRLAAVVMFLFNLAAVFMFMGGCRGV